MVSGDARVFGNAEVYGNAEVTRTPVNIIGLQYNITITDNHIRIGCQQHTPEKWESFTDREILEMDGRDGLTWWKIQKPLILGQAQVHKEEK